MTVSVTGPTVWEEWQRCKPWLEAALHRGGDTLTIDDVWERVASGLYRLWAAPCGAAVTQLCKGSRETELNVLLGGGSLDALEAMMPAIEQFGRDAGCSIVTVLGRLGWQRSFLTASMGYTPVAVLLGKRLHEQRPEDPHQ